MVEQAMPSPERYRARFVHGKQAHVNERPVGDDLGGRDHRRENANSRVLEEARAVQEQVQPAPPPAIVHAQARVHEADPPWIHPPDEQARR